MKRFLLLVLAMLTVGSAFVQPRAGVARTSRPSECAHKTPSTSALRLMSDDDDKEVNVNLIPDVDAFTLTAVGFGLIAFNFFVLANLGDAGLAGVIARIMNTFG
ncbi:hypothetical protein ACHAXT_007125 [Thalassiosira profunda]